MIHTCRDDGQRGDATQCCSRATGRNNATMLILLHDGHTIARGGADRPDKPNLSFMLGDRHVGDEMHDDDREVAVRAAAL